MIRRFLSVVPRAVQWWSLAIPGCAVPIAMVVGYRVADPGEALRMMLIYGGAALVGGLFVATWLLGLGFVYGDAKRRNMRAVLWVVVATLVPHLLGFLLYFALRQPLATPCQHCGMPIPSGQRFCSWCGASQPSIS